MGKLNLDQIQPGMILAADVLDRNGRVLLKNGLEIVQKHLTILKQWGVTEADIKDADREEINAQVVQSLDPEAFAKAEALHAQLFQRTNREDPFMQELFRLAVLRAVNLNAEGAVQ